MLGATMLVLVAVAAVWTWRWNCMRRPADIVWKLARVPFLTVRMTAGLMDCTAVIDEARGCAYLFDEAALRRRYLAADARSVMMPPPEARYAGWGVGWQEGVWRLWR